MYLKIYTYLCTFYPVAFLEKIWNIEGKNLQNDHYVSQIQHFHFHFYGKKLCMKFQDWRISPPPPTTSSNLWCPLTSQEAGRRRVVGEKGEIRQSWNYLKNWRRARYIILCCDWWSPLFCHLKQQHSQISPKDREISYRKFCTVQCKSLRLVTLQWRRIRELYNQL